MKKLFFACLALMLSSCIQVDDFGDYWDKATVDPSLEGQWSKVSDIDTSKTTGQYWTFRIKDGSYEIQTYIHGKPDEDGPIKPVRTLKVGDYTFLAKGPDKGSILRYKVSDGTATFYVLNSRAASTFIEKTYPGQSGFYQGDPDDVDAQDDPKEREEMKDDPLKIDTFDDDTSKILASIPDTDTYWDPDTTIKKMK